MWKERFCSIFSRPYYLPPSDKRFRNVIENMIQGFCMKKKQFSKLLLKRLHFAKNLIWVKILVSIAFQRYIPSPIWAMFVEAQPSTWGSSGRPTQALKLQHTHVHNDPRAKSSNEQDSYLKRAFSC